MTGWLAGALAAAGLVLYVRHQISKLRGAVEKAQHQMKHSNREARRIRARRDGDVDTRLTRLETSTALISRRHDQVAEHVHWTESWVAHWISASKQRQGPHE